MDDPDPAVLRMRALSPGGVEFRADEEQSADSERGHPGEQVGYLAIAGQVVQGSEADARIEFGDVSAAQSAAGIWQAVSFAGDYQYQRPVLITGRSPTTTARRPACGCAQSARRDSSS